MSTYDSLDDAVTFEKYGNIEADETPLSGVLEDIANS